MLEIPLPRINDCGLADYPPGGGKLGPRTLPDFEFLWMERGECLWEFDGHTEICPPGSVLLCPPGMRDTWTWDPDRITRHGFVHFDFAADSAIVRFFWDEVLVFVDFVAHFGWASGFRITTVVETASD